MAIDPAPPPRLGQADIHVHPLVDTRAPLEIDALLADLSTTQLDVVILCEHDQVAPSQAVRAAALEAGLRVEIGIGCEVSTADGHLLALFVEEAPPRDWPLMETVAAIHELGGLAVASHPLLPGCLGARDIVRSATAGDPSMRLDGMETFNPGAAGMPLQRRRAQRLAARYDLASLGGSDAHASAPGRSYTRFAGTTLAELRHAIEARATTSAGTAETLLQFATRMPRRYWRANRAAFWARIPRLR